MANKRELKKSINYVVGDLFQECIVLKVIKKADNAKVDEILTDILDLQNEFYDNSGGKYLNYLSFIYLMRLY